MSSGQSRCGLCVGFVVGLLAWGAAWCAVALSVVAGETIGDWVWYSTLVGCATGWGWALKCYTPSVDTTACRAVMVGVSVVSAVLATGCYVHRCETGNGSARHILDERRTDPASLILSALLTTLALLACLQCCVTRKEHVFKKTQEFDQKIGELNV